MGEILTPEQARLKVVQAVKEEDADLQTTDLDPWAVTKVLIIKKVTSP